LKNRALCGFLILTIGLGVVANILLTFKVQALNKNGSSILLNNKKTNNSNKTNTSAEEEKLLNLKYLPKTINQQYCSDNEIRCSHGECN